MFQIQLSIAISFSFVTKMSAKKTGVFSIYTLASLATLI